MRFIYVVVFLTCGFANLAAAEAISRDQIRVIDGDTVRLTAAVLRRPVLRAVDEGDQALRINERTAAELAQLQSALV